MMSEVLRIVYIASYYKPCKAKSASSIRPKISQFEENNFVIGFMRTEIDATQPKFAASQTLPRKVRFNISITIKVSTNIPLSILIFLIQISLKLFESLS